MMDAKIKARLAALLSQIQRKADNVAGQRLVAENALRMLGEAEDEQRRLIRELQEVLTEA